MNGFTELNKMLLVVSNELGKVVGFEEERPGVYYITTINKNRDNQELTNKEYSTLPTKKGNTYGRVYES